VSETKPEPPSLETRLRACFEGELRLPPSPELVKEAAETIVSLHQQVEERREAYRLMHRLAEALEVQLQACSTRAAAAEARIATLEQQLAEEVSEGGTDVTPR
jgi:phage shock protein A